MTTEIKPDLFSLEEVEMRIGVSRTTLWRHIANGELEVIRIGSRVLVSRRSLEEFLAAKSSGAYQGTRPLLGLLAAGAFHGR